MKTNNYIKVVHKFALLSFLFLLYITTKAQTINTNNLIGSDFCGGQTISVTYTITGTFTGSNTFIAQLSDGNGNFGSPQNIGQLVSVNSGNISAVLPTNSVQGYAYRIRVIGNSPSIIGSDNGLNLIINPMATANAGLDQSICANQVVSLSGSLGTVAPYGSWSTSGTGTFDNAFSLNANYTPSNADVINKSVVLTLTSIDPVGPCLAVTDQLTVVLNKAPTVNAGADQNVCILSNTVNLNGSIGGSAGSSNWTSLGTGSFNNSSLSNAVYSPSNIDRSAGFVKLVLTTDNPSGPCIEVRDTLQINFNSVSSINAGANQTICATDNITLLSNTSAIGGTLNWTSSGNGIFYNRNSLTPTYLPGSNDVSIGSVNLIVTNTNINNSCDNATDSMVLTINSSAIVNAGADISVCKNNNSIKLLGSIAGSSSSASWKSTGTGVFNDTNDLNAVYTFGLADKAAGFVKLALRSNNPTGPCNAVSDTLDITFNPLAIANAGLDQTICGNSSVNITGTVGGSATNGYWTSSTNNQFLSYDSITTYIPTLAEIASGSFFITFTTDDPFGPCSSVSDSMKVTVNIPPSVNAGTDITLCSNATSVYLSGTKAGTPTTTLWVTLNGSGTFDDPTLLNTIYRPSAADRAAKSIILSLTTNDPIGPCYAAFNDLNVSFKDSLIKFTSEIQNIYCDSMKIKFLNDTSNIGYTFTWDFGDGNFSTNANPIHTYNFTGPINVKLTANGPGGCIENINNNLSVNSIKPTANFTINNLNQCENSNSFVLNNVSLDGVSWITNVNWDFGDNTNSSSTTPNNKNYLKAGNYNIKLVISGSNGCKDSIIKGVNVLPSPVKPIITLLPGKILSSSSNISNQWYFGNIVIPGETSKTHVTTKYGIYNVRVDSSNGCSSFSDDFELKYTSITENNFDGKINIYPNPTNGLFNIESKMELYYSIYDYSGKEIVSGKKDCNIQQLDLSNFKSGIYLLKLHNNQQQYTTKIIKE